MAPGLHPHSFGIGLFVYQSLDAIDGKQARRTGTSGPLGELFDHGTETTNRFPQQLINGTKQKIGGWSHQNRSSITLWTKREKKG